MNILLLNHYAGGPKYGMEFRPYFLSKYWVKSGCNVSIIASSFSHLRIQQPLVKYLISHEKIDGINYHWVRSSKYKKNNILRIFNIFQFIILTSIICPYKYFNKKLDIVVISSTYPLDILPALLIKLVNPKAKLVFESHDLWPMVLTEIGGMSKFNPFVLLNSFAEKLSCISCDLFISMHPGNIDHLSLRGANVNMFYHIPNGIDLEYWNSNLNVTPSLKQKLTNLKTNNEIVVCYLGSISPANDIKLFLDSISKTKSNANYVIIGDGPDVEELKKYGIKINKPIYFLGKIPKDEVRKTLELVDICYVGFKPSPLYKYGMSANKLWDYMAASKPVIMSIDSCNDPVKEANCGITVSSGNAADIADALDYLIKLDDSERHTLGKNGYDYVINNNSYKVLSSKCLSLFSTILNKY